VPPYGDEGGFYYVARHLWRTPANVHDVYGGFPYYPAVQFIWERPLYYATLHWGALFGFSGFRLLHVVLASALVPLGYALARAYGVRRPWASAAALLLAVHPAFLVWGTLALADSLLAVAVLAGLLARRMGRAGLGWALLVAAVWIKETGLLALVGVLAIHAYDRRGQGARALRPWLLVPLALAPFVVSKLLGLPGPGTPASGYGVRLFEQLFLTAWLAPLVLASPLAPQTRRLGLLALLYPTAYLVLHVVLHRSVEVWYLVLPNALVVLCVAAVLNAADLRRPRIARVASVFVVAVLAVQFLAPNTPAKGLLVHPLSHERENPLTGVFSYEQHRDDDRLAAIDALQLSPRRSVVLVDVYGSHAMHPVATSGANVTLAYSDRVDGRTNASVPWADAIEHADATLVLRTDAPMNEAVRSTYADCIQSTHGPYLVLEATACAGRTDALRAAYEANAGHKG